MTVEVKLCLFGCPYTRDHKGLRDLLDFLDQKDLQ